MKNNISSQLGAAAVGFVLLTGQQVQAQRLYFANGADVEWSEVTLSGSNIQKKIRQADGKDGYASIPASNVARVDWPYPAELADGAEAHRSRTATGARLFIVD